MTTKEVKVFVSGVYDILHAGHIQFFEDAKALGTHLTVSFVSSSIMHRYRLKYNSLPDEHKKAVLKELNVVDEVVVGADTAVHGLEFKSEFLRIKPDILALPEGDVYLEAKEELCKSAGVEIKFLKVDHPIVVEKKVHVFVSGCYDVLHAGHVQFFAEARALGNYLSVSFAGADVLHYYKNRTPSLPDDHKKSLLSAIEMIDDVFVGKDYDEVGLDFKTDFLRVKPDILAVTEDDRFGDVKRKLCDSIGATYVVLPKTEPKFKPVSTTSIIKNIKAPVVVPVRVDFAGAWLDVPKHAIPGAYVVNCAVSPFVSKKNWPYKKKAGLGGSGAWAIVNGEDGVEAELALGVGWQDPAIISETGLCAWRSGPLPELHMKTNNDFLRNRMAVYYTGYEHDTPGNVDNQRDYVKIKAAGEVAVKGVVERSIEILAKAVNLSYAVQLEEGMHPLPKFAGAIANKYCGGGFGGYALYIFDTAENRDDFVRNHHDVAIDIEPYTRPTK